MSSEPPSKNQKTELSHEDLAHQFRVDFKSQLSKEILILLVDFLNGQLKFTPQEFGNSKKDLTGDKLCTFLSKTGYINSIENITTKFRELLAKVNEVNQNQFSLLRNLNSWLCHWIAKPGFQSKNQSELAANVESKLFVLMEKDLVNVKNEVKFIISPFCKDPENFEEKLVLETVLEFLNESDKKVLLILGNAGSGKSTCCQMILRFLWARYNSTEIGKGEIPLFASLPKIHSPSKTIVSEIFERNASISDKNDQAWLKTSRTIHFILDGYDELYSQVNLFGQTDLESFQGKIIISCRNESLPDLKLLSPPNSEIMKIYLSPFTEHQVFEYIANQTTDPKNFHKLIESIPSLKEFIQTPFHLKIITEILPQISEKLNDNRIMNRYELYDLFIRNRINQAIKNHIGPLQHLEQLKLRSDQILKITIRQCIEWSIKMRNQKSTTLSFDISESEIDKDLRSMAGLETKEQILRWLSPLLIDQDGDIVNCRFIHATIGEFFLVHQLNQILSESNSTEKQLNEIKKHPIFSELLGISTWQFISDLIKSNQKLKIEIWNLIELSKKSEEFSILAANCASIWNIAGFSFSGKDLRDIKIPDAFLNRAIFFGTDLRNANLRGCKLKDSILSEANLEGADLRDVNFGELAPWKLENLYGDTYKDAIIHENQFIRMSSHHNQVEIWNLTTRKLESSWNVECWSSIKARQRTILVLAPLLDNKCHFLDLKSGQLILQGIGRFDKHKFNADGSLMCSWNKKNRNLTLWDLKTSKPLWTTETAKNDFCTIELRFSLDNRYLLNCNYNEIIILNLSTGQLTHQFQSLVELHDCLFSVDGENVIGISKNQLFCWNLNSKSHRSTNFDRSLLRIWNIPNQDEILILDEDGNLIFFNWKSFTVVGVIPFFGRGTFSLSEDGTLFAFKSVDGILHLVDLTERTLLHSIGNHDDNSKILSFSRRSIYLLESNQVIRNYLWNSEESINTLARGSTQIVDHLHLTNDSKLICQHLSTVCVLSSDFGQNLKNYFGPWKTGSWCGEFFVTCSDQLEVSFWKIDAQSMTLHHKLKLKIPKYSITDFETLSIKCFSNVKVIVISISFGKKPDIPLENSTLLVISIDSFECAFKQNIFVHPKRKIFVTKEMIIWDLHSNFFTFEGQQISSTLVEWAKQQYQIRLATDFEILASNKNSIRLIDISTGISNLELKSSFKYPNLFYLCKRERFLVIGDGVGRFEIWDLSDQTIKTTIQVNGRSTAICASNDFSQLFIGTWKGSIWNFKISEIESSNPKIELIWVHKPTLLATNANLKGVTFSPDDNQTLLELHGLKEKTKTPKLKSLEISEEEKTKRKEKWNQRQILKSKRNQMSKEEIKTQLLKLHQINREIKGEMQEQKQQQEKLKKSRIQQNFKERRFETELKEEIDTEQSRIQQNFKEGRFNLISLVVDESGQEEDENSKAKL